MPFEKKLTRRLTGVFFLGLLLSSYPLLSLFNLDVMVLGVPLLYLYVFGYWAALIFLIFLLCKREGTKPRDATGRRGPNRPQSRRM